MCPEVSLGGGKVHAVCMPTVHASSGESAIEMVWVYLLVRWWEAGRNGKHLPRYGASEVFTCGIEISSHEEIILFCELCCFTES